MSTVGIDWGTSATALATWGAGPRPEPLGVHEGRLDVPTAVTFRGDRACLGTPAVPVLDDCTVTVRDLHQALRHGVATLAGQRVDEMVRDYFTLLLMHDGPQPPAAARLAAATGVVLALPHQWFTADTPGGPEARERLRRILLDRCRLPVEHVVSAPVAAIAYLTADRGGAIRLAADAGPVVVCDIGEWACEVTLFRIDDDAIRPVGSRAVLDDVRPFSAGLDRAVAEQLARQPTAPQAWRDDPDALRAAVRSARLEQHDQARDLLRGTPRSPVRGDTPVYRVAGQPVSADVVTLACTTFAVEIAWLVEQVITAAATGAPSVQLVLTGTLAELAPLPVALASVLRTQLRGQVVLVEPDEPARAVSYGAAALAAGLSSVDETLEPGMDVAVYGIEDGRLENRWLAVTPPNTMRTGAVVEVRTGDGKPLSLLVDDEVSQVDLRLYYTASAGRERELPVPVQPAPPPGTYSLSFQLARSGLTLVLRGAADGVPHRYPVLAGSPSLEAAP
jgi:hypothetical protein